MEESWEDLLCRVYYAGYEDCQRDRDHDPMGNEVVDTARVRAEKMEQRIRELEAALATVSEEMGLPPTIGPAKGELKRILDAGSAAIKRIRELEAELNEQVRLHGMGSEREAKQLTRINELETLLGFVVSGGIQRVNTELHQRIIEALESSDE